MSGREDVNNGPVEEGGVVPDGLHPGDRFLSLQECSCPRPKSQLIPLHGYGVTLQRHPKGTRQLTWAVHTATSPNPDQPDKGGRTLHGPTEGDLEAEGERSKEELLDHGGHVEACLHEIIRVPIPGTGPIPHTSPCPRNQHKPEGIPAVEDRGDRRRDRDAPDLVPPPPQGTLASDE